MVVQRVRLDQVYQVELVCLISARVCHPEVIPLRLHYRCSIILFKLEIIFKLRDLNSFGKIAAFKSAFKYQGIVVGAFQVVVVLELVVVFSVYCVAYPHLVLIFRLASRADGLSRAAYVATIVDDFSRKIARPLRQIVR